MKVGVIMGGVSSEREISLLTGKEICKYLNTEKYEVVEIRIDREEELSDKVKGIDFAFIALHGSFGEDGRVQAILENLRIPYSGSGVLSSALCMDKNLTKKLFKVEDILTPEWAMVTDNNFSYDTVKALGFPMVVKPNNGGSSIGTFIVKSEEELRSAVSEALKYDKEVLIEEYLQGEEITCCILNGKLLPILGILPKGEFFNFSSKYDAGGAEEIIVSFPKDITEKIMEITEGCWKVFKLKSYARIDMIIKRGKIYVLEINTLPGMTANSLFPKSAQGCGISFSELLDKIIQYSLE
jgi:D-alanine-D-alanine ligase